MGFFSFKCKACQESIKAPYELPKSMVWQNRVIVVVGENLRLAGAYDGYGRVNLEEPIGATGWTYELHGHPERAYGCPEGVWHEQCFEEDCTLKGADYLLVDYNDLASASAPDQGYFYERPDDVHLHRPFQNPDANGRVDTSLVEESGVVDSFNAAEAEDDQE